jgi:hypothetical protein
MSKGIVHTHAGDDSDGKIWGVEGTNILFLLAGLLVSVGLTLLVSGQEPLGPSLIIGMTPLTLVVLYVFGLRQGRPKSFDTDLLETFASGTSWTPSNQQPRNPIPPHADA